MAVEKRPEVDLARDNYMVHPAIHRLVFPQRALEAVEKLSGEERISGDASNDTRPLPEADYAILFDRLVPKGDY